jgi:HlyD family secretion protein
VRRTLSILPFLLLPALALACGDRSSPTPGADASSAPEVAPATPVHVATVEVATLVDEVSAPGRTVALVEQAVRAPFDGTVTELAVVEGSAVRRGQQVGAIVARDSEAARLGAQEMVRRAQTPDEKEEAQRALALAQRTLVSSPLLATVDGRVIARSAAAGDRVTADQELLAIAAAGSLVFRADVPQSDLDRVRPGQRATVEVAGGRSPLAARVHGLLTPGATTDLTAPLRLDFVDPAKVPSTGLYGTARIAVARHADVPVVPRPAVLRDDVSGTSRVGTVDAQDRLHWVEVATGLQDPARVEILTPSLAAGTRVVVSGQVGLAEGTPLAISP